MSHEHLISKGIFGGSPIRVEGSPWSIGEPRTLTGNALKSWILCVRHNNELSPVDKVGIQSFRGIRTIDNGLARGTWKDGDSICLDGLFLERWFAKTAVNLFAVCGGQRTWVGGESSRTPPKAIVEKVFGIGELTHPQGLYLWSGRSIGDKIRIEDKIGFVPVFLNDTFFVGAQFTFQGLPFLIWFGEAAPPWSWILPFYRHMGGEFRDKTLTAHLKYDWACVKRG